MMGKANLGMSGSGMSLKSEDGDGDGSGGRDGRINGKERMGNGKGTVKEEASEQDEDDDDDKDTGGQADDSMAATPDGKAQLNRFHRRQPEPDTTIDSDSSLPSPSTSTFPHLATPDQTIRTPENDLRYAERMSVLYSSQSGSIPISVERILQMMEAFPEAKLTSIAKMVRAAGRGQDWKMVERSSQLQKQTSAGGGVTLGPASGSGSIGSSQTPPQHKFAVLPSKQFTQYNPPSGSPYIASSAAPKPPPPKPIKHSAIYSNRHLSDTDSAASGSKPIASSSTSISQANNNAVHRGKKRKGENFDSDSDGDDGDDTWREGGRRRGKVEIVQDIDEEKVLEVFNTCQPEELTGSIGE